MDAFCLHTLQLLHCDAIEHDHFRDKRECAIKGIQSRLQTNSSGISNKAKATMKDILKIICHCATNTTQQVKPFAYLDLFDKLEPLVVVCVEELYVLYGTKRKLSLDKFLKRAKQREDLEEEERAVVQLLDPTTVMKSGEELKCGLEGISRTYESLFDLPLAKSNLDEVRMVLLVLYCAREVLIKQYAFSVFSKEVADWVTQQRYSTVLEVGCGKGYWSYELQAQGVNVVSQDKYDPQCNESTNRAPGFCKEIVTSQSPSDLVQALPTSSALLLCWVPKQDIPEFINSILTFQGQHLLLVGDRALCYSPAFLQALHANYYLIETLSLPRFLGVLDVFEVWKRKDT